MLRGVGIGVPGLVNPTEGIVVNAVNMGWQRPLRAEVQARLGLRVPVYVENDVRGARRRRGAVWRGSWHTGLCVVDLGSGLGSAAVVNGDLIHGALLFCPRSGTFGAGCEGAALQVRFEWVCRNRSVRTGVDCHHARIVERRDAFVACGQRRPITTHAILLAASQGDAAAFTALDKVGEWLGIVMATASMWLNPARFIIGGGLGLAAFDLIMPTVLGGISSARASCESGRRGNGCVRRVESSAVGAAALVFTG